MTIKQGLAALAASTLGFCAFVGFFNSAPAQHETAGGVTKAVAILTPTKGSEVSGRVTFTQSGHMVHVHAEIKGLRPGEHGFHVHEFGVWSEDGMASGGHFNPEKHPHAGQASNKRHVGDLGNVKANDNGVAVLDLDDPHLTLHGAHSIIGRGLVVHAKADDLKTQPTGDAGGRLAVGVIGIAKP